MSIKINFESKECSRCLGCGEHSYNLMHGKVCYGCGGSGKQLTKRGSSARAYYLKLLTKTADQVMPGDQIMTEFGMLGPKRWHLVKQINCDLLARQHNLGYLHIEVVRKGNKITLCLSPDSPVQSVRDQDDLDAKMAAAIAYQETLTQAGKPKKRG